MVDANRQPAVKWAVPYRKPDPIDPASEGQLANSKYPMSPAKAGRADRRRLSERAYSSFGCSFTKVYLPVN